MKILIFNLDVGSGIEYAGNIFVKWAKDAGHEVHDYKYQTSEVNMIVDLTKFAPDVIVMNEIYSRVAHVCFYYKFHHPNVKLIILSHSWSRIATLFDEDNTCDDTVARQAIKDSNHIFLLNARPKSIEFYPILERKSINAFMPVDPSIFRYDMPHADREKKFCYLGTIDDLKFSSKFIEALPKNIEIDLYGREPKDMKYLALLKSKPNLHYKGEVPQHKVPQILNQYKYYVLPHSGAELFNISLLQAIFCGTIPLVWNDIKVIPWWLHWADRLIFHTTKLDDFIQNLQKAYVDTQNMNVIAKGISEEAHSRFDFEGLKKKFISTLNS